MFTCVAAGYCFPEAPRWHADRLWFVDRDGPSVYSMTLDGEPTAVVQVPPKVMGLGFLPDGGLLAVSQAERRIYHIDADGRQRLFADFSELTPHWLNDMLVLPDGSGYVGTFGFDLMNHDEPQPSRLIRFDAAGNGSFTGPFLLFPNGIEELSSGSLLVAESFGARLSRLDVDDAGYVVDHHVFADLSGLQGHPDGMAIDEEDAVWYADILAGTMVRLSVTGEPLEVVRPPARHITSCTFVGPALDQLAITATDDLYPPEAMANRSGRLYLMEARVPGRRPAAVSARSTL